MGISSQHASAGDKQGGVSLPFAHSVELDGDGSRASFLILILPVSALGRLSLRETRLAA